MTRNFIKISLLFAAICGLCRSEADSVGTSFVTVLPWNNGNTSNAAAFSMSLINSDAAKTASVTIRYMTWSANGWDLTMTPQSQTRTVGPSSATEFTFPTKAAYQFITMGLNTYPEARVFINSDNPISVIAHNYLANGPGDSYTVMPTSMADTVYAFSVPAASAGGFAMIYFLPVVKNVTLSFTVVTPAAAVSSVQQDLSVSLVYDFTPSSTVAMYGCPPKDVSVYAVGSAPFVVLVAVRKLPVSSSSTDVDFGCFMPSPVGSIGCQSGTMSDQHVSDLATSSYFTFTPPTKSCSSVDATLFGAQSQGTHMKIESGEAHSPRSVKEFGDTVGVYSDAAVLNMVRYGGYNQDGTSRGPGSYLSNVPSVSQHVNGTTGFVVPTDSALVTFFGDQAMSTSATLDGTPLTSFLRVDYIVGPYYVNLTTLANGFHVFQSPGFYTIHIAAPNRTVGYGYTAAFNKQKANQPGTIAPPSSTASASSTAVSSGSTAPSSATSSSVSVSSAATTMVSTMSTASTVSTAGTTSMPTTPSTPSTPTTTRQNSNRNGSAGVTSLSTTALVAALFAWALRLHQ